MKISKFFILSACLLTSISISGCNQNPPEIENGTTFLVSASDEKISFNVNIVSEEKESACIYMIKASDYYYTDTQTGYSSNLAIPDTDECVLIQEIKTNEDVSFEIDRFDESGYDRIYEKFYACDKSEILAGPYWVTGVTPKNASAINNWSDTNNKIKGITAGDFMSQDNIKNQNACTYRVDMPFHSFYFGENPNAATDWANELAAGIIVPFESNGRTFYFNTSALEGTFIEAYKSHTRVTLILLANWGLMPDYAIYPGVRDFINKAAPLGYNVTAYTQWSTLTEMGRDGWIASIEWLCSRYGGDNVSDVTGDKMGGLENLVIGNEIDFAATWNSNIDFTVKNPTLEEYSEEIYRQLRLGSLAARKYSYDATCTLSYTHYWGQNHQQICDGLNGEKFKEGGSYYNRDAKFSYAPKAITDLIIEWGNKQGNFDWGLSLHPYDIEIHHSDVFSLSIEYPNLASGKIDSPFLVPANFEIIEEYLSQKKALYKGEMRKVFLPESGFYARGMAELTRDKGGQMKNNVTLEERELDEDRQLVNIIYFFAKIKLMKCVRSYQYFNASDWGDLVLSNHMFGLRTSSRTADGLEHEKKACRVYYELESISLKETFEKYKSYIEKYNCGKITFKKSDTFITMLMKVADALNVDILNFDLLEKM